MGYYCSLFEPNSNQPYDKAITVEPNEPKRTLTDQIIKVAVVPTAFILTANYLMTRLKWRQNAESSFYLDEEYIAILTSSLKTIKAVPFNLKDWLFLGM